jgi:uncharacterized protein (TIGR02217 family)
MTFINQRLPTQVEIGAIRRDPEDIEIVRTDGGWEHRNARQSQSLLEFEIAYPMSTREGSVYTQVRNFYKVARGALNPFRFRDISDYKLEASIIGTGNASQTQFQITKSYTVGSETFARKITRPVSPVQVFRDGTLVTSGVSVNYDTGLVTFTSPPGTGVVVTVTGEFDVPVRFDGVFTMNQYSADLDKIETIGLVEVREE